MAFLLRIALVIPAGFECCLQHHRRSAVVVITARINTTEVTPLKEIYRRELRSKRQPDLSGVCFVAGTGELAHEVLCHKKTTEHCALSLPFAEVIPAGWSVSATDAHRGLFFRLTLHSLMRFSTLKFQGSNMHNIAAIFTKQPKNNSSLRTRTAR